MQTRKLYRSRRNRMVAGVAGGLAEYLGLPSALVRFIWLLLFIPGGVPGALPYLLFWVLVPKEPRGIANW